MCLEYNNQIESSQASELCQSKDGKLPLPKDEKENADYLIAFKTMFLEVKFPKSVEKRVALDLDDTKSEGQFCTSSTGKLVEWLNWKEGEPSNSGEDFVNMYVFNKVNDGKWNDAVKSYPVHVFCEYEPKSK